nr:10kDa protein [Agapanthus velarivirus]QVY19228.1 10kDa protein [Agapanthus velarivirus]QVY19238.1 10kDa protein [Agapanthus velarivirus]QVY19248.1 10kDa protein [Agapanthus velarivirus]QVY19258.1 10kDa protein [Agapanthus velarivirus]
MPRSRDWEDLKTSIVNSGNTLKTFELGNNEKEVLSITIYIGREEETYYLANNPEFNGKLTLIVLFDSKDLTVEIREFFPYHRDSWI